MSPRVKKKILKLKESSTLVINEKVFKLSLLPSGIVREKTIVLIGNGVVIDPFHLQREIDELSDQNIQISPDNLVISDAAFLILAIEPSTGLLIFFLGFIRTLVCG